MGMRQDPSLSLLGQLSREALDAGYAAAAARRAARGPAAGPPTRSRWRSGLLLGAVLALAGLLVTTTVVQTQRRQSSVASARAALIGEIRSRTADTDALQARVAALRAEVAQANRQALALTATGTAAGARLSQVELVSGVSPVVGPGLAVVLDDADANRARGNGVGDGSLLDQGRVRDRDLQYLVNGLWAAGAEAVAVNGQRLTAVTAIRSAGAAILVDYRPLTRPYTVSVIGDPKTLEPAFVGGVAGSYFRTLSSRYGIRFDVRSAAQVTLPGASGVTLRFAKVGNGS